MKDGGFRSRARRKRRIHGKPLSRGFLIARIVPFGSANLRAANSFAGGSLQARLQERIAVANSVDGENCYSNDGPVSVAGAGARIWYSAGGSAPSKCFTK
jgi:hypothetical protein